MFTTSTVGTNSRRRHDRASSHTMRSIIDHYASTCVVACASEMHWDSPSFRSARGQRSSTQIITFRRGKMKTEKTENGGYTLFVHIYENLMTNNAGRWP